MPALVPCPRPFGPWPVRRRGWW